MPRSTRTSMHGRPSSPGAIEDEIVLATTPVRAKTKAADSTIERAPGARVLRSVDIPRVKSASGVNFSESSSVNSVSSASSVDLAESTYDSPATSVTATPAASVKSKPIMASKRTKLSNEVAADDQGLAEMLQLQEYEEYEEIERPYKRQRRSIAASAVDDSDDDLSSLPDSSAEDDMDIDEDSEVDLAKARSGKKAAVEPSQPRSSARKAAQHARTSIGRALQVEQIARDFKGKGKAKQVIDETDSDLSDINSDVYEDSFVDYDSASEAEEDSEAEVPVIQPGKTKSVRGRKMQSSDDEPLIISAQARAQVVRRQPRGRRGNRRGQRGRRGGNKTGTTADLYNPIPGNDVDSDDIEWDASNYREMDRKARERKKLEKAHPSIKTMWTDLETVPIITPIEAPQPESINRTLKTFQLQGLDWMVKQEKTQYKGGLLGDEMGMGKTIQAVSLIMSDYPAKDPTLVVVPPVALMQWSNEINEYTNGKLKVLVYHGQTGKCKGMTVKQLRAFDVIMVSYNSLESIHRKEIKGWTRGEDIVKEASPIHAIHFHRLILDEAHSIKSRTTGVAKACFALNGTYKWCLSGTPVQNRIGEFFSLLRFLEVRPFADYFCKKCPCAMLHWAVDKDYRCVQCKHSSIEHVSVFNQELLNPLTQSEDAKDRSEAMDKLHMITARIMLRRMKRDHVSSMELPPKEVVIHNEFFGDIERDFSSSIMSNTARTFDTYVSRGVMLNNYANIFGLIMQMRQVANHPDLLLRKHADGGQNVLVCNICDEPAEDAIRSKCKHDFCRACARSYFAQMDQSGAEPDCPRCHIALSIDLEQAEIEQDVEAVQKSSIINRIRMENWTSSTKIEMLVYDLWKLRSKKQTLKSIIFSQFTSMLQLVEWRLRRAGFNTVMLDGSMTPAQRQKSIDHFMNTPECEIFLVSLKAGGVALNLTEASRVFIIDPWWNPAAEWQSADRCHRIGQKRPCVITRLCIEDSVESRIVMLQEKKANMISGTINNDKVAMEKLTPEDMQFLFRGS